MAGSNLGTLTLDLVAKTGSFTGPLDKASRHAKKTSQDISKYGKAIGTAIGAGAVAAAIGIATIIDRQRELIDQQAKAAQALDTTVTSIANLARAGDLGGVAMEKIEAASRQLSLNLGKAIQGTDAQTEAFKRLGLNAQDIFDLPLDQRISKINQALLDNVQASERAAVAADIFGAKNAKAIQLLDPATIAEAARQVEIFGLNLSDIDAAKVEIANDAMSTFALLIDGVEKQLTVELAPALYGIGQAFLDAAEDAGGLGNVVRDTVRGILEGFALIASGIDVLTRATALPRAALKSIGSGFDADVISGEIDKIKTAFTEPLSGNKILEFYDDAQKASEDTAKATVEGRRQALEGGKAFVDTESDKAKAAKKTQEAIESQIEALQLQVAVLGLNTKQETLYKLALEGANAEQLKQAEIALDAVDAFEKLKKAKEEDAATTVFTDALRDQIELAQNAVDIEVESIGLGEKRANQLRAINQIQQEYAKSVEDLARAQGTANELSEQAFQARVQALKEAMDEEVRIVEEGERRKDEARKDALKGAKGAVEDYIDDANNLAAQTNALVENTLGNLEDSIVDFAKTGKLSFDDLANSIINDILRIGAKQLTANLAGGLLGVLGGGAGAAAGGGGGGFAGLFDSGGNIGSGQWGIVGESGPEIVQGPAAVTGRRETAAKLDRAISRVESGRKDTRMTSSDVNVNMTVVTPDANSFRKSERQVSHSLRRGLNQ